MTKSEKEILYNFLRVSQNYYRGFSDKNEVTPNFCDDKENQQMTLDILDQKVRNCRRCQLCKTRTNTVFGIGVSHPLVLVIGEGPGADEDQQGIPFVGKAGQLLDKMLTAINLSRNTNCYIANVVKCRPPANRNPLPQECESCKSYLETQIHLLKPVMILCVGKVAAQNLFKCQDSVTQMRGKIFDVHGIPAMMTYHPSALLRDENLKRPAWEDLKLFQRRLNEQVTNSVIK
ncbi:MAG: uracil-DNA glycosylase [Treponemataceae bacterium]